MYKFNRYRQFGIADFNQPFGVKRNLVGCHRGAVCKIILGKTGRSANSLWTDLRALFVQKQLNFSE